MGSRRTSPEKHLSARALSVSLLVMIVGAVAGCANVGSGSSSVGGSKAVEAELDAYTTTVDAHSADVGLTLDLAYKIRGRKADFVDITQGGFSWTSGQGMLSTRFDELPYHIEMSTIIDGSDTYTKTTWSGPTKITSSGPGSKRTQRSTAGSLEKGWSETTWSGRYPPDVLNIFSVALFLGFTGTGSNLLDPATVLRLLHAEASSVKAVGTAVVGGVETTHYVADIPLSRLGLSPTELREAEQSLGTDSVQVDYWTDASNLLRQIRMSIVMRNPGASTGSSEGSGTTFELAVSSVTASVQMDLSDYGVPVRVVPPPAKQITSHETCSITGNNVSCS
jgi:hypothetical protein